MNRLSPSAFSSLCVRAPLLTLLTLLSLPQLASAQPAAPAQAQAQAVPAARPARTQVGDATHNLLALQSSGSQASATPRPIGGDTAQLTYQRYLKSFEQPIPDRFISTVKSNSSGSSN